MPGYERIGMRSRRRISGLVYPQVYPENGSVGENEQWRGLRDLFRFSPRPPVFMRPSALFGFWGVSAM